MKYRRVPREEKSNTEDEEIKKRRADKVERISNKIHAAFWVLASIGLLYYTNLFHVAVSDERVNRLALTLFVISFVANMTIVLYATLYLPMVAKVEVSMDIYFPSLIPTSTALGFLSLILLLVSFWPVYGILTPLMVIVLLLGFLLSTHFIPWPC